MRDSEHFTVKSHIMMYIRIYGMDQERAQTQSCTVNHGIEMLLEQAACQFEIWTGESVPRAVVQKD